MLHIQSKSHTDVASLAFDHHVAQGNLLIVAFNAVGTADPVTVTDSVGTTYTRMDGVSGHHLNMSVYAGLAAGHGANTVTVAGYTGTRRSLAISEFSGADATPDATAVTAHDPWDGSPQFVDIVTTVASTLLYAAAGNENNNNTYAAGSGFTLVTQARDNNVTAIGVEYKVTGSAATYNVPITITGFSGGGASAPLIAVAFPTAATALCLLYSALLSGPINSAYSRSLTRIGGTGPFTFSITSGALPAGLSLNASTGTISGTPTASGSYAITVQVVDSLGATATQAYTVTISPAVGDLYRAGWTPYASSTDPSIIPSLAPANALDGSNSTAWFSQNTFPADFWVDMGVPNQINYIRWLPDQSSPNNSPGNIEIYLSADGVNWGNPVAWSKWPGDTVTARTVVFPAATAQWIRIHIVDRATSNAEVSCAELNVGYDPAIIGVLAARAPSPVPEGTLNSEFNYGIDITGGVAPYSVTVQSGALPPGLGVNNSGLISGIPTAGGYYTATIRVTDSVFTHIDVPVSLFIFRPGPNTAGATIVRIRFISWMTYTKADPDGNGIGVYYWAEDSSGLADNAFPGLLYTFLTPPVHRGVYPLTTSKQAVPTLDFPLPMTDFTKMAIWVTIEGSIAGTNLNEIHFYGCYCQADYSDGTRMYSYPGRQQVLVNAPSQGGVDTPANSIDGSLDTAAVVHRLTYTSLADPPFLRLDHFGEFTETPLPPVTLFRNFAY